ncbi:hypothetical protein D3C87_1629990 [compost metagenome]
MADFVTMSTHLPYSGLPVPSMMPGMSRNWRRTSTMTDWAASPTAFMNMELAKKGRTPPMKRPMMTSGSWRV